MMNTARNRFPFTASQWQELEHQALIFKYMASGMPIPPDLLFPIKRSLLDSSLSSKLILHQPQYIGWNSFQMGVGRKIDPEPGRCRRTDGKKWRCSKEAYGDSKYCERHMHRGRNRSRKPVEIMTATTAPTSTSTRPTPAAAIPISSITKDPNPTTFSLSNPTSHSPSYISFSSSVSSEIFHHDHPHHNHSHVHLLYPHLSSSRPPAIGLSSDQYNDNNSHFDLESGSYADGNKDSRKSYGHGMKEGVDEYAFFSETSGTMRSMSGSSVDDSWQLAPLAMGSSVAHMKQRAYSGLQSEGGYSYFYLQGLHQTSKLQKQDQHCYVLSQDLRCEMPLKTDIDDKPQKVMHHFFDEWPPKNKDSWLDPVDKTQLSISIANSPHDFFMSHSDK